MKPFVDFKYYFIYVVALLHITLFTYAAVSKVVDFQNFKVQLGQSPLLTIFADFLAYSIPTLEIIISIFLMVPMYRIKAIYASCFLMFLFTVYIVMILNFTSFVPCSCGGVLEELGWKEHLIFNVAFVILGISAILLDTGIKNTIITTIIGGSFAVVAMSGLYLMSEDVMQKENPFIRRFPQGTAARVAAVNLKNYAYYITGTYKDKVYLANSDAPLEILEYDSKLSKSHKYTIKLERENFPFKAVQVKVHYPYFYLYDKTVPVIYKGLVSDWNAKIVSEKQFSFNDIIFINDNQVIIRAQKANTVESVLALVNYKDTLSFKINSDILQKQFNSIFDTDGTMQYSYNLNKLIYTYYYRNQYTVTDDNLNIEFRGNTIDTTTLAKIKVIKMEKTGDTKLSAPPYMVNKLTKVINNLLFVNSKLRGRYENEKVWKNAVVIDVYDIQTKSYILSFYVHDENKNKMKDFFATQDALYIISGHYLIKYGFGERLLSKIKT